MLVWLTLPFYDFCGFRSVAVNSVYKLQFFTFMSSSKRLQTIYTYRGRRAVPLHCRGTAGVVRSETVRRPRYKFLADL